MGCCTSQPSRAASEAADEHGQQTSRTTNPTNRNRAPSTTSSASSLRPPASSSNRPNQRIRLPSPVARCPRNVSSRPPPWTRAHLEHERNAFFDTRVTGNVEVWSVLRVVCELLRAGEVKQAQGILDAAGLTCPTGRVARGGGRERSGGKGGVFDETGVRYDLPDWVVSDPGDVIENGVIPAQEEDAEKVAKGVAPEDESDDDVEFTKQQHQQKQDKGKGRAVDIGEKLKVRCRLSNSAMDLEVAIGSKQSVGVLIDMIRDQIGGGKKIRLVYLGRPLDGSETLEAQGWQRGHVLNALVLG